jgi:hypothetical protein
MLENVFEIDSRTKDPIFTARATFWKGETEYVLNEFKEALLSLSSLLVQAKPAPRQNLKQ